MTNYDLKILAKIVFGLSVLNLSLRFISHLLSHWFFKALTKGDKND